MERIKIGISSCLMGNNVRYDGGHRLDRFLVDTLGRYVDYVPVCPEVECGLSTPREPLRLVGDPSAPRLLTTRDQADVTEQMTAWAQERLRELETEDLCGFIFKMRSPSSGLHHVRVYNEEGIPAGSGTGVFARAFTQHFKLTPVEEDGRLNDPGLRETFIEQVFTMKRWREMTTGGKSLAHLVDFHASHKMLLLSHSPKHCRSMGKWVDEGKRRAVSDLFEAYGPMLLECLRLKTTLKKNANVLQHAMGHLKKHLSADEKQEMLDIIDDYGGERVPLIVPITLLNHYARKYGEPYLNRQVYLRPHPVSLKLMNHA